MPELVYLGPARSGKTTELLNAYREALASARSADGRIGPRAISGMFAAIWLAPNARDAALIRGRLLGDRLESCLRPGVMTFHDLSAIVIAESGRRIHHLSPLLERELIRRVVREAFDRKELKFFGEAADRSGFIDLMVNHVRELKRAAVTPQLYAKARSPRGSMEQQQELALLYRNYEAQLAAHGLTDADSAHWIARDLLTAGSPTCLQDLKLVVADGFTDFTPIQYDILQLLAQRAQQFVVTLPHEPAHSATARSDLFAKTAATLNDLCYYFPKCGVHEFSPRPCTLLALDHAVGHIFRNPAKVPTPSSNAIDSLNNVEIVAAAGTHDEIVQIARRIKRRLSSASSRPEDIAVVFRSLGEVAPRVHEVFAQFGIPFYLDADLPVATAPLIQTLMSLLRLAVENWPFRRVVSVITNNTLNAFEFSARQAADWLVRDLQFADGGAALVNRIEQLAAIDTPESMGEHLQRRVTAAKQARPAIQLLSSALGELPREATPTEWSSALTKLGSTLGLAPFVEADAGAEDVAAWQSIVAHLGALEHLDSWLSQPPRKLSLGDLFGVLSEVATHGRLPRRHDDIGRVRVLGAQAARTLSVKHLYLAGMSEQAFPSPERPGRLATDADYRFFARARDQKRAVKSDTSPPPTRAQEEMLLFYELLNRAEESLTISYPALDDKAQDLPPSPYVTELQRVFGEANQERLQPTPPHLSPISHDAAPCCQTDWRIQAVALAVDKNSNTQLLAGLFTSPEAVSAAQSIDAGLRIIHARARGDVHGPSEGLITSPAVEARLARRFGREHHWSPSQWESYAACPYQFFLQNVLRLEPLGELTLEVDHRRRGSLAHDMLATFHSKLRDAPSAEWAALIADEDGFAAALKSTLDEVMNSRGTLRDGIDAALLELDRREIEKWIAHYRAHYGKYDSAWTGFDSPMKPAHFELRFGRARPGDASPEDAGSVDTAFQLDISDEKVLITGRIDRIDIGQVGGKTVFNVIDYKSGQRPTLTREKIESGERLQPALYVMAAQALLFGDDAATPLWAGYWSMKNGVTTSDKYSLRCTVEGGEATDTWSELKPAVVARIREFVRAIRAGQFPVASRDPDCTSRCEFNTVCRVSQVRSLGKTWPQNVESRESRAKSQRRDHPQPPAPSP